MKHGARLSDQKHPSGPPKKEILSTTPLAQQRWDYPRSIFPVITRRSVFYLNHYVSVILKYTSANGGMISYYHDRYNLEADAVLHLEDGRYALIEFKLGQTEVEEGARHLCKIERLIIENEKTKSITPAGSEINHYRNKIRLFASGWSLCDTDWMSERLERGRLYNE